MVQGDKRKRRSVKEIDADLIAAVERMLQTRNIDEITLVDLISEANVKPNVFYRRYESVENVIKEFLSRYDFWFRRLIDLTSLSTEKDETFYVETLINLYTELKNNVVMQKILLWELTKNETAKEFANLRERLNLGLMAYYVGQFDMAKFDIACTTSILIAAIYYLILHKDISTFCGIDYSTESGDERIKKTLKDIGHLIFIRHRIAQQREKFCDFLTEKGLTSEDIEHCKTMIF